MAEDKIHSTGRRKNSMASLWLKAGNGKMLVNGREIRPYLTRESLFVIATEPLKVVNLAGRVDLEIKAAGGGLTGQAGAIRLALARALTAFNAEYRKPLKEAGMLTRDPRAVERKKYGMVKARKRFQFSKR